MLGSHPVQTFELRSLLQRPRLVGPVLGYVFPELERQMRTDAPMFLLLDDAAVTWLTPSQEAGAQKDIRQKLEQRCRDWLMTSAKKNVSLGFSTHSLSQVFSSALGPLLEEGCPSRFFLPMTAALEPNIRGHFPAPGARRTLPCGRLPPVARSATCTMCVRRWANGRFSLPLGPRGLLAMARNSASDHSLMDALMAREGPEGFAAAWYREHGDEEAATPGKGRVWRGAI